MEAWLAAMLPNWRLVSASLGAQAVGTVALAPAWTGVTQLASAAQRVVVLHYLHCIASASAP